MKYNRTTNELTGTPEEFLQLFKNSTKTEKQPVAETPMPRKRIRRMRKP